jgi:hypothetical protein
VPGGLAIVPVILGIALFAFRQSLGQKELPAGEEPV